MAMSRLFFVGVGTTLLAFNFMPVKLYETLPVFSTLLLLIWRTIYAG
jgi:hypothetical protein